MKSFRLLLGLIMICALSGCEKHDILDTRTTYCTIFINGEEYKDAPTLREQLGRNGYPNSTKERIFIRKNQGNIAYLQFLLADNAHIMISPNNNLNDFMSFLEFYLVDSYYRLISPRKNLYYRFPEFLPIFQSMSFPRQSFRSPKLSDKLPLFYILPIGSYTLCLSWLAPVL